MPGPLERSGQHVPAGTPGEQGPVSPDRAEEHPAAAVYGANVTTYYAVFGALIALTGLTVGASYLSFGDAPAIVHTLIAMAIAGVKAGLVLLFFMHLWHSPGLAWLVAFGALLWLAIMMVLTWSDYWSRNWIRP